MHGRLRRYPQRRFATLSFGFWTGPTRRKATLFALGLFAWLLLNLAPAIAVNRWNKFFFDALQNKDQRLILLSIGLMLALAVASALTSVALLQARMRFQLRWREWLTQTLVRRWMERRRFYQLSVLRLIDNPEARIAEDGRIAIELFVDFATGVTNALAHGGLLRQRVVVHRRLADLRGHNDLGLSRNCGCGLFRFHVLRHDAFGPPTRGARGGEGDGRSRLSL
jgi:ABC-type uncharacterized transport system fused permease/ATPase subunit